MSGFFKPARQGKQCEAQMDQSMEQLLLVILQTKFDFGVRRTSNQAMATRGSRRDSARPARKNEHKTRAK
jgi:hypothetical protein